MSDSSVIQGRFWLIVLVAASCRALPHDALAEQGKICGTTQIRKVSDFAELENCRIVEGNLYIVLIDSRYWENFNGSFPKLVEITDVLLLFRVEGLKSLGQLFPNLAVIGGQTLFSGYAFIVYELFDLEEIGLPNLTVIRNGAVRIEKNPRLCYIDTVDWGRITKGVFADENYFKSNTAECLDICPNQCDSTEGVKRCWNAEHCQKMLSCPQKCKSGFCHDDVCCHSYCVGGCSGPLASQCTACNVVVDSPDHNQRTCLQECPSGLYLYRNRTCLTADQCINFSDYKSDSESCDGSDCMKLVTMTGEDLDNTLVCSEGCPAGYQPDSKDKTRCVSCENGKCPKVCKGKTVYNLKDAKELKDCTNINGSLHFRLKHCLDEDKLEDYLGHIADVTGYVDISNSYGLHSLHMLKGLRTLGGQQLLKNKYALYVFNNQNLQELLPEDSTSAFQLVRGSVLFQHNGKLNYNTIMDFLSNAGIEQNINDGDISEETNGDKITLQTQKLRLTLKSSRSRFAIAFCSAMHAKNPQDLIGYSFKWKEVSERSITVIPEDDICQDEGWNSQEVDCIYDKCSNGTIAVFLSKLKPMTQYAVYVRAVTVTDENAVSNVVYFKTLAGVPTVPLNVQVEAKTPGSLHLTWDPPAQPNGNVIKYRITYTHVPFRKEEYRGRDYCTNPLLEIEKEKQSESAKCCACAESSTVKYSFQDILQNAVYVKRKDDKISGRNRRDSPTSENENRRTYVSYVYEEEHTITNLGNYEEYSIKVQACHNEGENKETVCSDSVVVSGKTLQDALKDVIPNISIEAMTDGIELKWQDPTNPNGVILTYEIEYVADQMDQSENVCIPNDMIGDNEYELTGLTPGNYMIRLRATSLAGVGPWTSYSRFIV